MLQASHWVSNVLEIVFDGASGHRFISLLSHFLSFSLSLNTFATSQRFMICIPHMSWWRTLCSTHSHFWKCYHVNENLTDKMHLGLQMTIGPLDWDYWRRYSLLCFHLEHQASVWLWTLWVMYVAYQSWLWRIAQRGLCPLPKELQACISTMLLVDRLAL